MNWRTALALNGTALAGSLLATSSILLMANRFIDELTRPGVSVTGDDPMWGGWIFPTADPPPPEMIRHISFSGDDHVTLQGQFWAQPEPAPTVVLSHGFRVDATQFASVAALEYAQGFNVFLFDFRGHGRSTDGSPSGGTREVGDLCAAISVARCQPETKADLIFVHGFSMGAAVALMLPPRVKVAGIIADSPFAHLDEMLRRIISSYIIAETATLPRVWHGVRRGVPAFTHALVWGAVPLFYARFRHGLITHPLNHLNRYARHYPPLLLIHAQGDPLTPLEHTLQLAQTAARHNISTTTYIAPIHGHCCAFQCNPGLYIRHLLDFARMVEAHGNRH